VDESAPSQGGESAPTAEREFSLSRWSRLKRSNSVNKVAVSDDNEKRLNPLANRPLDKGVGSLSATAASVVPSECTGHAAGGIESELPSLSEVRLDKDFTPFMQAKVPEALRRQALKALFKDAHFNTMDGLDTYIDDYTQFEPISAADLEKLSAWQSIKSPLQQVVTPGGYAVDIHSEEGKAVLAAREALQQAENATNPAAAVLPEHESGAAAETTETTAPAFDAAAENALPATGQTTHSRYGKRVADFRFDIQPLNEPASSQALHVTPSPATCVADPR
jgi:hypothetical protein